MKVLVTGSADLPGNEVLHLLEHRGIPCLGVDAPDFDPTDADSVRRCVEDYEPDTILHFSEYPDTDKAESLPEKCACVNGFGALTVARAAVSIGAKLLFFSSSRVFPGTGSTPFAVSDPYGPQSVFGMSKVQAEDAVRSLMTRYYIVRSDWVYGTGGKDFLHPLLQDAREKKVLHVAGDQTGSPTWSRDLARAICDLIETDRYGIWHIRNEGYCSRAEFAEMVIKKAGISCRVVSVPSSELSGSPRQPLNLRLAASLPAGINPMPSVEDALDRCLAEMKF